MEKIKQGRLRELISAQAIDKRVGEIAAEINSLYAGEHLIVICVLKGGVIFFSDLIKKLDVNIEIDFVRLASYGQCMESGQNISFTKDVELSLAGKHVLIIEDIIDSGLTLDFLTRQLAVRDARSIRIAVLIDKRERRVKDIPVDFVGFHVPKGFVVGYGLDLAENYRQLPAIYEILTE